MQKNKDLILIVDDEEDLRCIMSESLEAAGYKTLMASHGRQAVEIFKEKHEEISLVLCDITMPQYNGIKVIEICLRDVGYIPIVMITAHEEIPFVQEALRLGAIDYIIKPFDVEGVISRIPVWEGIAKTKEAQFKSAIDTKVESAFRLRNSSSYKKLDK